MAVDGTTCQGSRAVFSILILKLGEFIQLVQLEKCFMDYGIYYL